MGERRYELVLVGGGLANGLIAWRLAETRPDVAVTIVEQGPRLGGEHTWSFFDTDLTPEQRAWIEPIVAVSWREGYDVAFPERRRTLSTPYNSAFSERLHEVVAARAPAERLILNAQAVSIGPDRVVLADQRVLTADAVIDARGPRAAPGLDLGFQKFLGLEVKLDRPHGLTRPIVMDATVPQIDGYRFVYVLPFSEDTLLIEDTYYADGPALPVEDLRARVLDYAEAKGWTVERVLREETGVLPIALGGSIEAFWDAGGAGVPRAGLDAALFHPTTGYSLPDAVETAFQVAALPDLSAPALYAALRRRSVETWGRRGFFRLIDRMLFRACAPSERYRVLQRFYGLPEPLIRRFYGARMTVADKARVLAGKPPVPIGAALKCLSDTRSNPAEVPA